MLRTKCLRHKPCVWRFRKTGFCEDHTECFRFFAGDAAHQSNEGARVNATRQKCPQGDIAHQVQAQGFFQDLPEPRHSFPAIRDRGRKSWCQQAISVGDLLDSEYIFLAVDYEIMPRQKRAYAVDDRQWILNRTALKI